MLMFLSPGAIVSAQTTEWHARTVDQVLAEIVYNSENEISYTVTYGDTLSIVSEAMGIAVKVLADINNIEDVDLIFPETVLTAQFNDNQELENLIVESPSGEVLEFELPQEEQTAYQSEQAVVEEVLPVEETETTYVVAPVEEWITEEEVVEETVVNAIIDDSQMPPHEETQSPGPSAEENMEEDSFSEETIEEQVVYEEVISEEIVTDEPVYEAPVEEVIYDDSVEEDIYEQPTEEELIEEIPDDIYEDIQEEEVITEEEIVYEDPAEEYIDPMANPENAGLQPHAAAYKEEVANIYGVDSFSLYRPGDSQDHGQGLAVDFMVPVNSQLGDDIANYSTANMAENNISYVIWEQEIYGDWNYAWTPMEDRGSVTANHYDHVHVSFNPVY